MLLYSNLRYSASIAAAVCACAATVAIPHYMTTNISCMQGLQIPDLNLYIPTISVNWMLFSVWLCACLKVGYGVWAYMHRLANNHKCKTFKKCPANRKGSRSPINPAVHTAPLGSIEVHVTRKSSVHIVSPASPFRRWSLHTKERERVWSHAYANSVPRHWKSCAQSDPERN